jgi:hypothetical protein
MSICFHGLADQSDVDALQVLVRGVVDFCRLADWTWRSSRSRSRKRRRPFESKTANGRYRQDIGAQELLHRRLDFRFALHKAGTSFRFRDFQFVVFSTPLAMRPAFALIFLASSDDSAAPQLARFQAAETMAKIVAERLVEHLSASGFVVMRKPPAGGTTPLHYPDGRPHL